MESLSTSAPSKRPALRANPSQTAVLKEAYARSTTVSADITTELHQKTGLPTKWIAQWFARRRSKERRLATNSATRGPMDGSSSRTLLTSSSDIPSPSDTSQIKLEDRDNVLLPRSSPSMAHSLDTSMEDATSFFGASGSAMQVSPERQMPSSTVSVTRGRRKKQTVTEKPPPRKRGRKKNNVLSGPLQPTQIKQENPDIPGVADGHRYSLAELASNAHTTTFSADILAETRPMPDLGAQHNRRSTLDHAGFQIAPPKRSTKALPITELNMSSLTSGFAPAMNTYNSTVATTGHHHADHGYTSSGDVQAQIATSASPLRHQGIYQRTPIFRMGFQNSGPDNFTVPPDSAQRMQPGASMDHAASTYHLKPSHSHPIMDMPYCLPNAPTTSSPLRRDNASDRSIRSYYLRTTQAMNPHVWPTLADASERLSFDLSTAYYGAPAVDLLHESYQPETHGSAVAVMDGCQLHAEPPLGDELSVFDELLDPSSTPLKHLVDILADFKDENGGFSRLRCEEQHSMLIQRLSSDELLERNYFQAAMGHVLLDRLGLLTG